MARPMTPDQMLAAFKAEGLTIREMPGWRDRCRCHDGSHEKNERRNGRAWGEVYGSLTHITAGDLGRRTVEQYIRDIINGDPKVPTKAQIVTAPNGDVWVNSAGRCNHAGEVGAQVKAHLIAADFSTTDDYDDRWRGASVDGNAFTYGNEVITSKTMTPEQYRSSVLVAAAIARFHKWTGQESVGHGEVSAARYKVDPGLDMGKFRRDVMARVKAGAGGTKPAPVPPKPAEPQPEQPIKGDTYTVQPGDTLASIARRKGGATWQQLGEWNQLGDPAKISVGLVLRLTPPTIDVTYLYANVAGYNADNAPGVTRWKANVDGIAALVNQRRPDLALFVELSNRKQNPMLPRMDDRLADYERAKGSDGRYIYRRNGRIGVRASWVYEVKNQLNGDDKQMACAHFGVIGEKVEALVGVLHAEHESTRDSKTGKSGDQIRVEQGVESWKFLVAEAKKRGVPPANVFLIGDFNSESWVVNALADLGVRVLASARFTGWDRRSSKRFDYVTGIGDADGTGSTTQFTDHQFIAGTLRLTTA